MTIMVDMRVIFPDLRCVKQSLQYTSAQSFEKQRYIIKLLCFTLPLRLSVNYLRTTMKGTYANARNQKSVWRNNSECVPRHLLRLRQTP
jgi:hypothetical protein